MKEGLALDDDEKVLDKRALVEQEVDECLSSDESSGEIPSIIGCIEISSGSTESKAFKPRCVILSSGSLFLYKDTRDTKVAGHLALHKYKINPSPTLKTHKKEFVIELKNSGDQHDVYLLSFSSETDKLKWLNQLELGTQFDPVDAPIRDQEVSTTSAVKKQGLGTRAKKRVAGDIASSAVGKKVLRNFLNEETISLLTAIRHIVTKANSKKKSDELEKNVIKLMVKAYLLVESKKLTNDAFLKADQPLRKGFDLLVKCYNARGRAQKEVLFQALTRAETSLKEAEMVITQILQPHLSAKNMLKLSSTCGYLGSVKLLEKAYSDETLEEPLEQLIDAMQYYTQFSYN